MKTLDYGILEADDNTARAAHKASFWLVDKESIFKPSELLIIERATATSESVGGRINDWGAGVVWSRKDKSKDKSIFVSIWKVDISEA